ncbi:unnamed protein product [Cuscuta epithymum]|uniref:Uncharacterized protein n=1 Tax=Cuscuta epithymum TaxID=186058 RepID=A0AAV0C4U4_9ASTE|nr:unnamed protein product [Cuscuta epithymum]
MSFMVEIKRSWTKRGARGWIRSGSEARGGRCFSTVGPSPGPPEPPPWSAGESRVWKQYFNFIICLLFNFHGQTVLFYFYCFFCCKTLALGLGGGSSAVTVIGFISCPNLV